MTLTASESAEVHTAVLGLVRATGHERFVPDRQAFDERWQEYVAVMARMTEGTYAHARQQDPTEE